MTVESHLSCPDISDTAEEKYNVLKHQAMHVALLASELLPNCMYVCIILVPPLSDLSLARLSRRAVQYVSSSVYLHATFEPTTDGRAEKTKCM